MTPLKSWKCKLRYFLLIDNAKLIKISTVWNYLYCTASIWYEYERIYMLIKLFVEKSKQYHYAIL